MTGGPQPDRLYQDDRLYRERNGEAGAAAPLKPGAQLGLVVDGSLANGVEVRLNRQTSVEDLKVGTFVTIRATGETSSGSSRKLLWTVPTSG